MNESTPITSIHRQSVHKPKTLPLHVLEPDHFVVEKIINHKGYYTRPSTMQLYVKWLGWDDNENSWIKWQDNQDLAALDTYLTDNPDIKVPIFKKKKKFKPIFRRSGRQATHVHKKPYKFTAFDKEYIFHFRAPKTVTIDALPYERNTPMYGYAAYKPVPEGTPRRFQDIINLPEKEFWSAATQAELDNMYEHDVWETITIPEHEIPKHLILPSQLIYDKQKNPDGTLKKYKCRLVIRGDKWYDVYNMNNYASTVKSETVRLCLAVAAIEDMEMESVDIKGAFLYSPLKPGEDIYMRRPPGLTDLHMPKIVKLKKCLYGMPQASAYFHEHSDKYLRSFGCIPTPEDDCCYTLDYMGHRAIIKKHVDDFGLLSKSRALLNYIKNKLSEVYVITEDPEMKFYLGYHIIRDRGKRSILLNQLGYILEFADRYHMPLTGPFPSTPMEYLPSTSIKSKTFLDQRGITDYQPG